MKKIVYAIVCVMVMTLGIFIVHAATPDTTVPTLKSVSIKEKKESYNAGDKVYLNLDAYDDISGISYISAGITAIEKDNDEESLSGMTIDVYDFDTNPYFEIPSNLPNGKYTVDQIYFTDNAGNWGGFTNFKPFVGINELQYLNYDLTFRVKSENNDTTPPVLKNIRIDKNKYTYGEKIKVIADASDDKSGIKTIEVRVSLKNSEKFWNLELNYNSKTNKYEGLLETPAYDGKYYLNSVEIVDNNNNFEDYSKDTSDFNNIEFEITGAPILSKPHIQIEEIDFDYKKLIAPTIFKLRIKLDPTADMLDRADVTVSLNKFNAKSFKVFLSKDEDGYLSGYADISQFNELGIYYIQEICLYSTLEWISDDFIDEANKNLEYEKLALFELTNDNVYDIMTSTTDKELISKIRNAKNDAKISISSVNSSIVPKGVFEAIKDTNKKVYIESDGIQWVFDGKDITKPKDIDVDVTINFIYNDDLNNSIGKYVNDSLVIYFENNGKLPGIAKIRLKMDYALRDYLGVENLNVYYYNPKDNNDEFFEMVAYGLNMSDDGYLEFFIDHNSTFIISNKKVEDKYVSDEIDNLALNDENVKKEKEKKENIKKSKNILLYSAIGAGIVLIIAILTIIIIKKHKIKNKVNK